MVHEMTAPPKRKFHLYEISFHMFTPKEKGATLFDSRMILRRNLWLINLVQWRCHLQWGRIQGDATAEGGGRWLTDILNRCSKSNFCKTNMPTDRKLRSRNASFSSQRFLMLRWWWGGVGWGGVGWGMLTFVWTCWGSWCYADDVVGRGGVGHVNVRVNLLRFLMLRWWWGGEGRGGAC